jgi:hypothetical protein
MEERKTISKKLAGKLLYKFLRKENILYEYCFETMLYRKQTNYYLCKDKTMREKMNYIIPSIVEKYQHNNVFTNQIGSLFACVTSSFAWNESEKGYTFWCRKSDKWLSFLGRFFKCSNYEATRMVIKDND